MKYNHMNIIESSNETENLILNTSLNLILLGKGRWHNLALFSWHLEVAKVFKGP